MTDPLHAWRVEWARDRQRAIRVDETTLNLAPRMTDTTLARPWKSVMVPRARLDNLTHHHYWNWSHAKLWHIGFGKRVANCNPIDIDPGALSSERMTRRPGQSPFDAVVRGAYGNRNFKYLFAIDHLGMHIAREMTRCDLDSRGIITHSKLVSAGVIGGEIFFDIDEHDKVYINFGSARLPIESNEQAEATAEFVLALGYRTVVAMIPERNLQESAYGMADRYGRDVQNVVYRAEAAGGTNADD